MPTLPADAWFPEFGWVLDLSQLLVAAGRANVRTFILGLLSVCRAFAKGTENVI
jgi:hypothetical protein